MRQQLKDKIKDRRLSISADLGNKNGVDFFGNLYEDCAELSLINIFFLAVMVQFQDDGKIIVLNLACRRVSGAHTADNIKLWFKDILSEFGIDENQLLVFAIDSAANIQKAAREYLSELEEKFAIDPFTMSENFNEDDGDSGDNDKC